MNSETTLAKLLEGWLDGGLSDAEQSDLLCQLGEDPQLRRRFAEQVAVLGETRAAADANPRWLALFDLMEGADGTDGHSGAFEVVTMSRIESASHHVGYVRPVMWGLAAAVALLLAGGFLLSVRNLNLAGPSLAGPLPVPSSGSTAAVVIASSPESRFEKGARLEPRTITLNTGWITLQTLKGVSITLDAPFEVSLLDNERIRLKKGRARVRVPDGAEGFRLESPVFDVVDLGTEFAAKVNADGTGTCRVFEGKADVFLLDSMGEAKQTHRLNASESVLINPSHQALQVIEEKDSDYPAIKQEPRPKLHLAPSYAADVLGMAPAGYWRFESITGDQVPNEVPGRSGIRMHAVGSAAIAAEDSGNHSGELTRLETAEYFKIQGNIKPLFEGDFSIIFFAQFSWFQNFAMISAMRYDDRVKGHPFILQSYADLSKRGIAGSALHAVFRDPPAWDGGKEAVGSAQLRPLHWHHLSMRRHNGDVTLFLDGEIVARETAGSMPLDCREIFLGRLNGNARQSRSEARGMVGHIDELAIFPRALSDEEILQLGKSGLDPE